MGGGEASPPGLRYPIPAGVHRVEDEVRRSRFITTLAPAPDEDAARAFVERMRAEFPDATHTCWAWVVGPPGSTSRVGMSDDGEPHGTAGRPMLAALLHGGVGEVVATVTRYYGGVKLGRGGLGRAYAGGVQQALESLPLSERVARTEVRIRLAYGALDPLRRVLDAMVAKVLDETFAADVRLVVAVPDADLGALRRAVADLTSGDGEVSLPRPPEDAG